MKWLFIIVVFLNITFGGYNLYLADESNTGITGLNVADKSQIILLDELDPQSLNELKSKISASKTITDAVKPVGSVDLDEMLPETEVEPDVDNDGIDKDQDSTQDLVNGEENLCYKLGPFSKDDMNNIRHILEKEYNHQLSFAIETTSAITYYRIYIPPLKNKSKIKETLALLNENGLKDHYVMSIDGRKNAIALGVFKQKNAAKKVAAKATEMGLSTTIEAISDDKNSLYQLLIFFQKDQQITRYQEIILEKEFLSVECDK